MMRLGTWKRAGQLVVALAAVQGFAAPAHAAKKAKVSAVSPKNWALSEPFRKLAEPVRADIVAQQFNDALVKLGQLDSLAQSPDEKFLSASLRYQVGVERNDLKQMFIGCTSMLASGSVPESRLAEMNAASGHYSFLMANHRASRTYFTEAAKRGIQTADHAIMLAESNFKLGLIPDGMAAAREAIRLRTSAGQPSPEGWFEKVESLLVSAGANAALADWNRGFVKAHNTAPHWNARLLNYVNAASAKSQKVAGTTPIDGSMVLDTLRLLRLSGGLANKADILSFADVALRNGAPLDAKRAINDGWTTGVVDRGDALATTYLAQASKPVPAPAGTAARKAQLAADAQLQAGNWDKAAALYKAALGVAGGNADLLNTRLGIALAHAGQKADARTVFAAVKGQRADIAGFWLLWLDLNPA